MFSQTAALKLYLSDSDRMPAAPASARGGTRKTVRRCDQVDDWRGAFVDGLWRAYCRERGIRQPVTWPAPRGPHWRCEAGERFLFRGQQ